MVSIWYRHKEGDVELEPLASEMDFEISTLEELLEILDISKGEEK